MLVRVCGYNGHANLGLGYTSHAITRPIPAPNFGSPAWVQTGSFSSMVRDADGSTRAVGGGLFGQRCDGSKAQIQLDVLPTLLPPARMIDILGDHGIAVLLDNRVATWGSDGWGTLGIGWEPVKPGDENEAGATATPVFPTLPPFQLGVHPIAAAAGYNHSGVVLSGGGTLGVGRNRSGQVGDSTTIDRLVFTRSIATGVKQVACGWAHKLYRKADGSVWFVGHNGRGQGGPGCPAKVLRPRRIEGIHDCVEVAAAGQLSVARLANGDVLEWGEDNPTPRLVLEGCSQVSVACYDQAGFSTVLMVREGDAWGRGRNDFCQIGDGTRDDKPTAVPVGVEGVAQVCAGEVHSLLLVND